MPTDRSLALCLAACGVLVGFNPTQAAGRRVIQAPKFDPDAARIELFQALESGALTAKVVPRDAAGGTLFIENHTDQPLTVEMPEAVVGVQVLPQDGPFDLFLQSNPGDDSQAGGNQPFGTGFPGGSGQTPGDANAPPANPLFSIPAERVARVQYRSVCLEHGKTEPQPRNTYRLVRVEEFTSDPAVHELLKLVGTGALDQEAAQAAAWHLADHMSWEALRAKTYKRVAAPDRPYFTRSQLRLAEEIVAAAQSRSIDAASPMRDGESRPEAPNRLARKTPSGAP